MTDLLSRKEMEMPVLTGGTMGIKLVPEATSILNLLLRSSITKVRTKEYLDARVRLQRPEIDPRDRELLAYVDG